MAKQKIALSDALQEMIAYNQEQNCETAKSRVEILDKWMGTIISGHGIAGDSAEERMEILDFLFSIKQDYQSLIVE
ncbi:MAG: hypothetical protein ACRCY5_07045 [Phocaeicola sp.]